MGSNVHELPARHQDMLGARMECSWAGNQCLGFTEVARTDSRMYTLELEPGGIRPATGPGLAFWRKEKSTGLSCLMANNRIGFGRITSYRVEDITNAVIPFETYTATVVFISRRVRTEHFSKRASWMQSLSKSQKKIEAQELRLHQLNSTDKPATMVTVNGNERIEEPVTFDTDVNVSQILAVGNLTFSTSQGTAIMGQYEGVLADLDRLIKEILGRLGDAVPIDKPVAIDRLNLLNAVVGQILSKNGAEIDEINKIDLRDLITTAVSANEQTPITGRKSFSGPVHINGNMQVNGLVAGRNFPGDILTTNSDQDLKGIWKFDHPVTVEEATIIGQLNGVDMNKLVVFNPARPTANITYPARIKFLDNMVVEGDIIAYSVDGIDLAALAPMLVTIKGHQIITAPKVFQQNVHVIGDVNLHKTVNGFSLPLLDASVVKLDQQVDITGHKIFKDNVVMGSLFVYGKVKDYIILDDFVLNNTTATITGKKTFQKQLIVKQNVFVDQFVDGIPLHALVTLNTEQTIPDLKIFTGGVEFRNLDVEGKLDGITVEELRKMHASDYQPPTFPTEFDKVTIARDLSSIESINGFPVAELHRDTVLKGEMDVLIPSSKIFKETATIRGTVQDMQHVNNLDPRTDFVKADTPQLVTGRKIFAHKVKFTKGLEIKGLLDGVNVTDFGLTSVTLSTQQEIRGTKVFTDGITVNGHSSVGVIDNVAIPGQLLMPQNPQPIVGRKTFLNGLRGKKLVVDKLILQGNLNGVNWEAFMSKRITLLSPQDIMTSINFTENVFIHGNLHVYGNINTVNLHQLVTDVMRKSVPQTVTGPKTVLGLAQAQSTVKTRHGLDGVDLAKLNRMIVPVNDGIISSPYSFPDIRAGTELNVNGRLGPLDLDHLIRDSVMKVGPLQRITAPKTFSDGLTVEGNMNIEKVNNFDIIKSVLSRTRPQMVTGEYELTGQVVVEKDLIVRGKINKLNLVEFNEQVMKTDETTSTNGMAFEDDLNVDFNLDVVTTVNAVNLPELVEDAVLKIGPAKITGKKIFTGELAVNMNVDVQRYVNGFSLSAFASDVVFVTGVQVITSPKHFSQMSLDGDLTVGNLTVKGRIEGVSLPNFFDNAVLLHDEKPIHGHKTFAAPVHAQSVVVTETLNVIRFPRDVVTTNGHQTVNGLKHFHHVIVATNVNGELVNGQNLAATARDTLLNVGDQSVKGIKVLQQPSVFRSPVDVYGKTCGLNFQEDVVTVDLPQQITGEKTVHHMTVTQSAQINNINGNELSPLTELWRIHEEGSSDAEHHFMGRTRFNYPVNIMTPPASVDGLKNDVLELGALQKRLLGGLDVAHRHCVGYSEIMNPLSHAAVKLHHFDDIQYLDVLSSTGLTSWMIGNKLHMVAGHDGRECRHDMLYVWDNNADIFVKTGPLGTPGKSGHWHAFVHKGEQYLAVSDDFSCGSSSKIWHYNREALRYEVHCHLNTSASQMSTLQKGEAFYLVVGHTDAKSEVMLMDISNKCSIIQKWNIFPESSMVTVVESLHMIIFSNIRSIFSEVYHLSPQQEFIAVQRLETPGIKDIVSVSTNQHFVILNRKQYPSKWTKPMDMVQIYTVSSGRTEPMALVKEIPSEMLREVLDLEVFRFGPHHEPYLAILHKKTGVMITPLYGLLTYDGVKLPMPQAKKMHAFTIQGRPYVVLNQVDPRQNAHVYRGNLQGTNVQDVIKC